MEGHPSAGTSERETHAAPLHYGSECASPARPISTEIDASGWDRSLDGDRITNSGDGRHVADRADLTEVSEAFEPVEGRQD